MTREYRDNPRLVVDNLLKLDDFFIKTVESNAFRPEFRIVLNLVKLQSVSVKEAMIDSNLSSRGFYLILGNLIKNGIVEVGNDISDKRVRRLTLARKFILDLEIFFADFDI